MEADIIWKLESVTFIKEEDETTYFDEEDICKGIGGMPTELFSPLEGIYNFFYPMAWGIVKHERLPHIYFHCGCIGHIMKHCPKALSEENKENLGYGEWPKAYYENSILNSTCTLKIDIDWERQEEAAKPNP